MTFRELPGGFQAGCSGRGEGGYMTEYETDPQRRPAPSDAEPSHPTAELSRAETGLSDSPAVESSASIAHTDPTPHT
ncbi:peptidase S1, partial [Micromonospora sp. KC207]